MFEAQYTEAIDSIRAALTSPAHADDNARLADALFERGWTAVLDAISKVALPAAPETATEPVEVSFRVCGLGAGTPHLLRDLCLDQRSG